MVVFPLPGAPRNAAWRVNSARSRVTSPAVRSFDVPRTIGSDAPLIGSSEPDLVLAGPPARGGAVLAPPAGPGWAWNPRAIEIEDVTQGLQQAERFALLEPGIERRVVVVLGTERRQGHHRPPVRIPDHGTAAAAR